MSQKIGTSVMNLASGSFQFHEGPVFTNLLLVDEVNRMPPRTQATLLECMEERQVTVDGLRRDLPSTFTVFATQNPIEFEGTYPLPEAQLDRFLVKIRVPYPEAGDETSLLSNVHRGFGGACSIVSDVESLSRRMVVAFLRRSPCLRSDCAQIDCVGGAQLARQHQLHGLSVGDRATCMPQSSTIFPSTKR